MARKGIFAPSEIDEYAQKLDRKSIVFRGNDRAGIAILFGLLASGFGLVLLTGGLITLTAPELAVHVPICRGNPHTGLLIGAFFLVFGAAAIVIGRTEANHVMVSDDCFQLQYRSGRQVSFKWHELDNWFQVFDSYWIIRLKNRRFVHIRKGESNLNYTLNRLLEIVTLLKPYLDETQPFLGEARRRLISQIVGPGLHFPFANLHWHSSPERRVVVYSIGGIVTLALSLVGWLTSTGPLLGLVGIVIALVADWASWRVPEPNDRAVIFRDRVEFFRLESDPVSATWDKIKSWILDQDKFRVKFNDGTPKLELHMDWRNSWLLLEAARCAANLKPVRIVSDTAQTSPHSRSGRRLTR